MNEQKFSTRQALSLSTLFMIGQTFMLFNGGIAKTDAWISILIAWAAMLPVALVSARLITVFPGRSLFDLHADLFGRAAGWVIALYYTLFSLHVGSLILRDTTEFLQITTLWHTPQLVSAVMIITLCIYTVKSGINTLGRYTAMALPVYILMVFLNTGMASTLFSGTSHIPPPLYGGLKPVLLTSVNIAALPFADGALLPFVLQPLKQHKKARAIFLGSYTICATILLVQFFRNLLVLGNLTFTLYFPTYVTMSLIDIADFLQRIEVAIGAVLFMGAFVKLTVFIYVLSLGLSKVFRSGDYRKFAAPAGFLVTALSLFAYPNLLVNLKFAANIYPFYTLLPNVLIPLATWIAAELRRRKLKAQGCLPSEPPAATETPVGRQDGGMPKSGPSTPPAPSPNGGQV